MILCILLNLVLYLCFFWWEDLSWKVTADLKSFVTLVFIPVSQLHNANISNSKIFKTCLININPVLELKFDIFNFLILLLQF